MQQAASSARQLYWFFLSLVYSISLHKTNSKPSNYNLLLFIIKITGRIGKTVLRKEFKADWYFCPRGKILRDDDILIITQEKDLGFFLIYWIFPFFVATGKSISWWLPYTWGWGPTHALTWFQKSISRKGLGFYFLILLQLN